MLSDTSTKYMVEIEDPDRYRVGCINPRISKMTIDDRMAVDSLRCFGLKSVPVDLATSQSHGIVTANINGQ